MKSISVRSRKAPVAYMTPLSTSPTLFYAYLTDLVGKPEFRYFSKNACFEPHFPSINV